MQCANTGRQARPRLNATLGVEEEQRKGNSIEQRDGRSEVIDGHSAQILRTTSNFIWSSSSRATVSVKNSEDSVENGKNNI